MKINQVEELVGITKKNIRFYEDKGLIHPERNLENGYRNYTLEDVEILNKIKLLRKLDIPIETIRQLEEKHVSMEDCMTEHIKKLSKRQQELDTIKEMCQIIAKDTSHTNPLDAGKYLEDMRHLEEGGTMFMDVKKQDVKRSKLSPILAALCCITLFITILALIITEKDVPIFVLVFFIVLFGAMSAGVIIALKQRLHEIEGGEIDEARKY
ncbi:MAG: MerR family transcriptional regulator [Lachnospiraceae bacterium]|nr:MerR family transcriptional regulator [Lachnospiraceae bacterium]